MNLKNIDDIELEINGGYPEFIDSYIMRAGYYDEETREYRPLTDDELNDINENEPEFVYEQVIKQLF